MQRTGTSASKDSAADWRRHRQPCAHRRENCTALRWPGDTVNASRSMGVAQACWANRWSRLCRSCRPITTGCASCTPVNSGTVAAGADLRKPHRLANTFNPARGRHPVPGTRILAGLGYIDWTPFSRPGMRPGKYPAILDNDGAGGGKARKVFADARPVAPDHRQPVAHRQAGALGFWPANTVHDDDIELYANESRRDVVLTGMGCASNQQVVDGVMRPSRCLADRPKGVTPTTLTPLTTGIGVDACRAGGAARRLFGHFIKALADPTCRARPNACTSVLPPICEHAVKRSQ